MKRLALLLILILVGAALFLASSSNISLITGAATKTYYCCESYPANYHWRDYVCDGEEEIQADVSNCGSCSEACGSWYVDSIKSTSCICTDSETAVSNKLSCSVVLVDDCVGTIIFKISAETNAHAEVREENNYGYAVCCNAPEGVDSLQASYKLCSNSNIAKPHIDEVIVLSGLTNAHVGNPTQSDYNTKICLQALPADKSSVDCKFDSSCVSPYVPLASISGDTNAHVGEYGDYDNKLCCKVESDFQTQSICGDGSCDAGENCPADASSCPDNPCYEPTCIAGCGKTMITNAEDPGECDYITGCTNPPCECDSGGNCIPLDEGSCDPPCGEHATCVSGNCECDTNWGDCDTNPTNCETDLTTALNCGSCGWKCISGQDCIGGICISISTDNDKDGVNNEIDKFPDDPCSIYIFKDNCGNLIGTSCAEGSINYCESCDACGDGIKNCREDCDNEDWGTISNCEDLGLPAGTLSCSSDCKFDTSLCVGQSQFTISVDTPSEVKVGKDYEYRANIAPLNINEIEEIIWYFEDSSTDPWGEIGKENYQYACIKSSAESCKILDPDNPEEYARIEGSLTIGSPCICKTAREYPFIYTKSVIISQSNTVLYNYKDPSACGEDNKCTIRVKAIAKDENLDPATSEELITLSDSCSEHGAVYCDSGFPSVEGVDCCCEGDKKPLISVADNQYICTEIDCGQEPFTNAEECSSVQAEAVSGVGAGCCCKEGYEKSTTGLINKIFGESLYNCLPTECEDGEDCDCPDDGCYGTTDWYDYPEFGICDYGVCNVDTTDGCNPIEVIHCDREHNCYSCGDGTCDSDCWETPDTCPDDCYECEKNEDCPNDKPLCDMSINTCVECLEDGDCEAEICYSGKCMVRSPFAVKSIELSTETNTVLVDKTTIFKVDIEPEDISDLKISWDLGKKTEPWGLLESRDDGVYCTGEDECLLNNIPPTNVLVEGDITDLDTADNPCACLIHSYRIYPLIENNQPYITASYEEMDVCAEYGTTSNECNVTVFVEDKEGNKFQDSITITLYNGTTYVPTDELECPDHTHECDFDEDDSDMNLLYGWEDLECCCDDGYVPITNTTPNPYLTEEHDVCEEEEEEPECIADSDCPDDLPYCDQTEICVACTEDEHCGFDEICYLGECMEETPDDGGDDYDDSDSDLCGNGRCDLEYGESYSSCPRDCHCGNNVCDSQYLENPDNCPEDCKKSNTLLIVVLIVIFIAGIVLYFMYKKGMFGAFIKGGKEEETGEFEPNTPPESLSVQHRVSSPSNSAASLSNYIKACRAQGFSYTKIKEALLKKGWQEELVNKVFGQVA